jgi:hypothetical protein
VSCARLRRRDGPAVLAALGAALLLGGCATQPPVDFAVTVPSGVTDARGRFDEIYCSVLEEHGRALPDYRPCSEALSHVADQPAGSGRPVDLAPSRRGLIAAVVPGIGYSCVSRWMKPDTTIVAHVREFGYDLRLIDVDGLSGTTTNARRIRDAIMAGPADPGPPRLVLIGYSKGAPDILEAVVSFPEIRDRIAAVVSVAGAVGGSPIAEDSSESLADLMRFFPGATCDVGDEAAVASLRPDVRKTWLAEHPLPPDVPFYSVVTLPDAARISRILKPTYRKLARLDPRNDSQVIYLDQVVPDSTLLGFMNADHWAIALPIARSHPWIGSLFLNHNDYPREALLEAVLRFVEEDLDSRAR